MHYSPRQYAAALNETLMLDSKHTQMEVADGLRAVHATLGDITVRSALMAPDLNMERRTNVANTIVTTVYRGAPKYVAALSHLISLLASNRQLHYIPSIAKQIDSTYRVELTLTDFRQESFTKPLQTVHGDAIVRENEKILGGFQLRKGDDMIDASIATGLRTLQQHAFDA